MTQRCLLWLADLPVNNRVTFQPSNGSPELIVLSSDCKHIVWHIRGEAAAEMVWTALRLTFPSLAPSMPSGDSAP